MREKEKHPQSTEQTPEKIEQQIKERKIVETRTIEIRTIENFLPPEEIQDYHKEWNLYRSREKLKPIDHRKVLKINPDHVVISDIWQYKDHPIYRAEVFQDRLSWIPMDPPQPIWHEYHYWQVFEQIAQAVRKKLALPGKAKTPITYIDLEKPIYFGQRISVELIPEIKTRETKDGPLTIENHYATFYKARGEPIGRMYVKVIGTLRDYEIFYRKLTRGEEVEGQLVSILRRQKRRLETIGRSPKTKYEDLVEKIRSKKYDQQLLDGLKDFFSLWDLE